MTNIASPPVPPSLFKVIPQVAVVAGVKVDAAFKVAALPALTDCVTLEPVPPLAVYVKV